MSINKQKHEELKKTSREITELLKSNTLSPDERKYLESVQPGIAGALMSTWIPFGLAQRIVMIFLFSIGIYGLINSNFSLLLAWLFLPLFSPKIVGASIYHFGRFFGNFTNK
jgi:uncharacterized protein (DUF2062 family)